MRRRWPISRGCVGVGDKTNTLSPTQALAERAPKRSVIIGFADAAQEAEERVVNRRKLLLKAPRVALRQHQPADGALGRRTVEEKLLYRPPSLGNGGRRRPRRSHEIGYRSPR